MNWTSYPFEKPKVAGKYIVSVKRPFKDGEYVFSYCAHYEAETDKWHKHDPFTDENAVGEEVPGKVVGWVKDAATYLG